MTSSWAFQDGGHIYVSGVVQWGIYTYLWMQQPWVRNLKCSAHQQMWNSSNILFISTSVCLCLTKLSSAHSTLTSSFWTWYFSIICANVFQLVLLIPLFPLVYCGVNFANEDYDEKYSLTNLFSVTKTLTRDVDELKLISDDKKYDEMYLHLSDAFIQSDLRCIQSIHLYCQYVCSLGIKPTTFALLTQCSTTEPQEHASFLSFFTHLL